MSGLVSLTMACLLAAAELQGLPPHALVTILSVEGGRIGEVSQNRNGSVDLGPMQINDRVWVPVVADLHFSGDRDRAYTALRDNGCYNVHIGAWILRQAVEDAGGDLQKGIGWYHSRTPKHTARYQRLFREHFNKLFGRAQSGSGR